MHVVQNKTHVQLASTKQQHAARAKSKPKAAETKATYADIAGAYVQRDRKEPVPDQTCQQWGWYDQDPAQLSSDDDDGAQPAWADDDEVTSQAAELRSQLADLEAGKQFWANRSTKQPYK